MAMLFCTPLQATQQLAPDAAGYQFIDSIELYGPKYRYTDISTTGKLLNLQDDSSVPIRFGFGFNFYGKTYYTANVSDNGYISFNNSDNNINPNRLPIPQKTGAGWQTPPFIAPWFDDLDPQAGGAVYYEAQGDWPNRHAIIQWSAPHHDDPTGAKFEFQVVLYEGTNQVLFQYRQTNSKNSNFSNGASASVGIQGSDSVGINYPGPLTDQLAIGFTQAKYGYVGLVEAGDTPWERSGTPGQVLSYQVEVFNNKIVEDGIVNGAMTYKPAEAEFIVAQQPGSRWKIDAPPSSTGIIAPGKSATLQIYVTVPAAGSASMADDIASFKVTEKVAASATSSSSSSGGSSSNTNTQDNQQGSGDTTTTTSSALSALIYLKSSCAPTPCFQQDSDGDGLLDSSEAADTVNDAAKAHGVKVLSGALIDVDVTGGTLYGFTAETAVGGPPKVAFDAGVFNYRIRPNHIADTVTVRFTPPAPWSDQLVVYKVGSDGTYKEIDADLAVEKKRWQRVANSNAIELTLVDGGDLDEDGVANGVIVDPLAIGLKVTTQSSGGVLNAGSGALFDELLLLVPLAGIRYAGRRSRRRLH